MGSSRAVPYIHRHPKTGHLNYRRRIPDKLRRFIPGEPREFVRTLAAHSVTDPGATERHRAAANEYDLMIAKARKAAVSGVTALYDELRPDDIRYLADFYPAFELMIDEEARWGRPTPKRLYEPRLDPEGDYADGREALNNFDDKALASLWGAWTIKYAAVLGYALSPKEPTLPRLYEEIAGASCKLWLALEARNDASRGEGKHVATPPLPAKPEVSDDASSPASDSKTTFESIANAILDNPRQQIGASTKESSATALRFFREFNGAPTPAKISRSMVSQWFDLLAQRPARLPLAHRGLSLPKVVQMYEGREDVPRLTAKTYNGHASALAALWTKAMKAGQIRDDKANPFTNHRVTSSAPASDEPKGFSNEELQAIFALPIFRRGERPKGGKGEASYWMPLFMLWTGARPEEVAQLMVDDFHDVGGGAWTMTFTDLGGHPHKGQRSLKTTRHRSGRRTIPIPQALLDLGLAAYIEHLRKVGETALFPLLRTKGARRLLGAAWSEWWGKLIYEKGILSKKGTQRQPLREFRHTWTTAASGDRRISGRFRTAI